ncbi:Ser-Thr-rich glycosyl-phosphatidyl-inositol-anchored membrane family-domain-containing protein [Aspergillus cavernicola]|uniref:Ser-Thr-rich glycosyl-phosphatidyl-inositol-anchored membrane family-domain-containing protein n=1 Tax=Aspergillus cavernicola TaxID=176166 RepID=A0ABR4HXN3_9EURO
MRLILVSYLLPLAVSVGALSITEPKKGDEITPGSSFTVKWDSVSTDPTSFDIYLVNNAVYPSVDEKIASDIDTSDGSYTVDGISDLAAGHGYQINLFSNSDLNTGILAQSQQFNVTDADSSSSTTSSTSSTSTDSDFSTSTTPSATTSTSTETTESSSSSTTGDSSPSASGSSSSAASSSPSASVEPSTDPNAGVAMTAPLTIAAGLLGGALLFNI